MNLTVDRVQTQLRELVTAAADAAMAAGTLSKTDLCAFNVEVPADKANGDFSTNAAMVNARTFRLPPRKIAEALAEKIEERFEDLDVEVYRGGQPLYYYLVSLE